MSTGMPLRDGVVRRYVTAYCPHCHATTPVRDVRRLSGVLVERGDRVWLERGCPRHGLVSTLYDEDPRILDWLERWTAPTKQHGVDSPGSYEPVPGGYLGGLGEMQTQHTCILLQDVVETCTSAAPPASRTPRPTSPASCLSTRCWRTSTSASPVRAAGSTC